MVAAVIRRQGVNQLQAKIAVTGQLGALTRPEPKVLELMNSGFANKGVARVLRISLRTVEVHRPNLMAKLEAAGAVNAVRLWLSISFPRFLPGEVCCETLAAGQA